MQRGRAIAEARRSPASSCFSAVRERTVVKGVTWWYWLRALRRLLDSGWAARCCIVVPGLATVLKGIANKKASERSITSAEGATTASTRPDGVTSYTGSTIEVAELSNALWEQSLSPVLLGHVQHEAVIGDRSEGRGI